MSTLALNKRAVHDYDLLDKYEGGLVLTGPEVKSAKDGHIQLKGAFVEVRGGELWLKNAHISRYKPAGEQPTYDPDRNRKVLVHKRELARLLGKSKTEGLTLIPISVYLSRNLVKLSFAIARGKKQYEKRETIKKREVDREIRARMKG